MAELTSAERVRRAGDLAGTALRNTLEAYPPAPDRGPDWPTVYAARDRANGRPNRTYALDDPRFVLLVIVREWRAFPGCDPVQAGYAREARSTLNKAAHDSAGVSDAMAARLIDTLALLLTSFGLDDAANEVRALAGITDTPTAPTAATTDPAELTAGNDVATPETATTRRLDMDIADLWDAEPGLHRLVMQCDDVAVYVFYAPNINYALAHNDISPVREIRIINGGTEHATVGATSVTIPALDSSIDLDLDLDLEPDEIRIVNGAHLAWHLDHFLFASVDEAVPTTLSASTTINGTTINSADRATLLAHDEWVSEPLPELLASFVRPNTPIIGRIAADIADAVAHATGDSTLNGYQDGSERADAIGRAAYEALAAHPFRVTSTPAPDGEPLRIRRADAAIESGEMNTLEAGVLLASVLEHIGLHPVILHTPDGFVGGYLRDDVSLTEIVTRDHSQLTTLAGSGYLAALDLTGLDSETPKSYRAAIDATDRVLDTNLDDVRYAIDIAAARRRVKPLPLIKKDDDGVVVSVEREAPRPAPRLINRRPAQDAAPERTYHPRVQRWRQSLLDLSFRNPLLKLRTGSGLELVIPEAAFPAVEDDLASGLALTIHDGRDLPELYAARGYRNARAIDEDDLTEILADERTVYALTTSGAVTARLDSLRRTAATTLEETGANNLFITFGALHFTDPKGGEGLAPLFLLPAKLIGRRGTPYTVQAADDAEPLPNYCLIEKLRRDYGLVIPELSDPPRDDAGINIEVIFQIIRQEILKRSLPFTVEPVFRLTMLQFATLEMWRDLSLHWEEFLTNPVVRHLVDTPTEPFIDPVDEPAVDPAEEAIAHLPVPSDGAQLKAVRWARAGRTFVLQGPPGTGKSQTITNMIADTLAAGRTVLFVAEKAAALDVVKRRLDQVGLGPLTLELHGPKQTIRGAREQLARAWDEAAGLSIDPYDDLRADYARRVTRLAAYPPLLEEPGPHGLSLRGAYTRRHTISASLGVTTEHLPPVMLPPKVINGTISTREVLDAADRATQTQEALGRPVASSPWVLAGPSNDPLDTEAVYDAVTALDRARRALDSRLIDLITGAAPSGWPTIVGWLRSVSEGNHLTTADLGPDGTGAALASQIDAAQAQLADFRARYGWLLDNVHPAAMHADVAALRHGLSQAHQVTVLMKRRAKAVAAAEADIRRLLLNPDPSLLVSAKIDQFLNDLEVMQHAAADLARALHSVLPGADPTAAATQGRLAGKRQRLTDWQRLRTTNGIDATRCQDYLTRVMGQTAVAARDAQALDQLGRAWTALLTAIGANEASTTAWLAGRQTLAALDESLPKWTEQVAGNAYGSLQRVREARAAQDQFRDLGLIALADDLESGAQPAADLAARIEASIANAALNERRDSTALDTFDGRRREREIDELLSKATTVRAVATQGIPRHVRELHGVDTNRPTAPLAALRREFQRKRGGSIRDLVERHGNTLLSLTPCLLMSPQSVARFIPVGSLTFDLVIFDEASQIRVADAIGSLGRSRAAVIVGDSMQMPPSSMFASKVTDDEDTEPITDLGVVPADQDSILTECTDSNVAPLHLTWHYRSQDERLISFSNNAYYQGRLASFPTTPDTQPDRGLSLVRVDGRFDGGRTGTRTNQVEADAIVAEIDRRLAQDPDASIGVITFNIQQRNLLLDMLEDGNERLRSALNRSRDPIFVKNLENVQGDERDVILFSLAYSVDPETGRLPLRFGPLMTDGGEKRLNVAVTRARRQVTLFASFSPEDIDLSRTSSRGVADLRDYLIYARGEGGRDLGGSRDRDVYRTSLVTRLRRAGLDVIDGVGLSSFKVDIAVRTPGATAWVGILLDTTEWARRSTVGDRELLPQIVLKGSMGWPEIVRVWLPEWLADEDAVVQRIVATTGRAADEAVRPATAGVEPSLVTPPPAAEPTDAATAGVAPDVPDAAPSPPRPSPWMPPVTAASGAPGAPAGDTPLPVLPEGGTDAPDATAPVRPPEPDTAPGDAQQPIPPAADDESDIVCGIRVGSFTAAPDRDTVIPGVLDDLQSRAARTLVLERIREILDVEGPIEAQRLGAAVGRSFGLTKVRTQRTADIVALVPTAQVRRDGAAGTSFIWPEGVNPADYTELRLPADGEAPVRTINQITAVEIVNAAKVALVREQESLPVEELIYATKDILGYKRMGSLIHSRINDVLRDAIDDGRLIERDLHVHVPADAPRDR